jgi:hypothetical protein
MITSLIGRQFGSLSVVELNNSTKRGATWVCECECGTRVKRRTSELLDGDCKSCGRACPKRKRTQQEHPLFGAWLGMIARCHQKSDWHYKNYGARGIVVCERWRTFGNFASDMGDRPRGHQLERVNNDGPYSPDNCIWATPMQQNRNSRNNRFLVHDGQRMCMKDWANKRNIPYATLFARLKSGWSVERALTAPLRQQKRSQEV